MEELNAGLIKVELSALLFRRRHTRSSANVMIVCSSFPASSLQSIEITPQLTGGKKLDRESVFAEMPSLCFARTARRHFHHEKHHGALSNHGTQVYNNEISTKEQHLILTPPECGRVDPLRCPSSTIYSTHLSNLLAPNPADQEKSAAHSAHSHWMIYR